MGHQDKVAVVVGASMGIGAAICKILAEQGCDVVCAARSEGKLQEVAKTVRDAGRRAEVVTCDVRNQEQIDGVFKKACLLYTSDAADE